MVLKVLSSNIYIQTKEFCQIDVPCTHKELKRSILVKYDTEWPGNIHRLLLMTNDYNRIGMSILISLHAKIFHRNLSSIRIDEHDSFLFLTIKLSVLFKGGVY